MSALKLSNHTVMPPCDDASAAAPCDNDAELAGTAQQSLPIVLAAEHLLLGKPPACTRPGALTPRKPLSTLPSARKAARRHAAGVSHAEAGHHVEMQEPPQTHSDPLSAVFTTNSELDLDLPERPDTLAMPEFPTLTADMRRPDAQAHQSAAIGSASRAATKR